MVRFFVTGFGPFSGVPDNPTQRLVEMLESRKPPIAVEDGGGDASSSSYIVGTAVLEVAAQPAREFLAQLYHSQKIAPAAAGEPVVVVHLGVDVSGRCFKLEQQAVNDATFRCPDQRGWQPRGALIDDHPGCTLATRLLTDLDVSQLAEHLAEQRHHDVHVSLDAGRFVCNFTYYLCLMHSQEQRQRAGAPLHALFVHVPPAAVVPLEEQYSFLLDALAAIAAALAPAAAAVNAAGNAAGGDWAVAAAATAAGGKAAGGDHAVAAAAEEEEEEAAHGADVSGAAQVLEEVAIGDDRPSEQGAVVGPAAAAVAVAAAGPA